MEEIWKDIDEFEGIYQVSNFGRLKSFKCNHNGVILKNTNRHGWYFTVNLCSKFCKKSTRMHRLVAIAFIPNPENKAEVNHKDMNKQNNHVDNLEWVTPSENNIHATKYKPWKNDGMIHYNKYVKTIPIIQLDLNGNFIEEFVNSKEASLKTGVCQRNINQVAYKTEYKKGLTRSQAGGFIWKLKSI